MASWSKSIASVDSLRKAVLAGGILSLALWGLLLASMPGIWRIAEELSGDWIWRMSADSAPERRVVLVDIDESSLKQLGGWPWPRDLLAQLSDQLASEGASLQVFDIVLPAEASGDLALIASLKANQGLLSQVFALENSTQAASGQPSAPLDWQTCPPGIPEARGYVANAAIFKEISAGHITPLVGDDGVVRLQPSFVCHGGKVYPALFLAALMHVQGSGDLRIEAGNGFFAPHWQLTGTALPERIPLDRFGNVRIPWDLRQEGHISLSASDVLARRIPQGLLTNAWVLIGSTALGLNDRIATPFGGSGAGMTVHAQLLRGALDGRIPAAPRLGWLFELMAALLGAVVLVAVLRYQRQRLALQLAVAGLLVVLLLLSKAVLLVRYALWVEWVPGALFLTLFAFCQVLVAYARSVFERDRLYNHLASYLPSPVAEALARQDPSDVVDAKRKPIVALFADIRNFSAFCETRTPEESTKVLHAFFSTVTCVVEERGGLVESLQGDAVLAVWDSGQERSDSERALQAALDIFKASRELLPQPQSEDLAPLGLGIGLEAGIAIVGSFGLARRRTHLAIGHPVSTAARLQEMTSELAHPILIGGSMAASLDHHQLVSQGMFLLEGLKAPCHIFAYPLRDCVESN